MRANSFMRLLSSIIALCVFQVAEAGAPLWTFTALTATTVSVPAGGTATIQYRVTNQSQRSHALVMQPIQGITQTTTGAGICSNPFTLAGKASCTLSLVANGSQLTWPINNGPLVCQQGSTLQCYRPSANDLLNVTQSNSDIMLDTVSPSSGPASGGTGVTLTGSGFTGATSVTFGGIAATDLNVVNSTTVTAVTPANNAGAVDVVITTPGGSGTKSDGYTYNATAVGQAAYGGTIACLNGGLNNLIATAVDNSTGISWGGTGTPTSATSTTDGAANTSTIVTALGGNGGVPYAAQLCSNFEVDSQGNTPCQSGNACYNDWFLPAGNNSAASGQLNCLYTNNVAIGGFANATYWSSAEVDASSAYVQDFSNGIQSSSVKSQGFNVRCVRAFTP